MNDTRIYRSVGLICGFIVIKHNTILMLLDAENIAAEVLEILS